MESLQKSLSKPLKHNGNDDFDNFILSCNSLLDKYAPWKKINVRGNQVPFINKEFSKAIMLPRNCSKLTLQAQTAQKLSNTLKQFVANLPMNCLSVFDHFVRLALKGLRNILFKKDRREQKKV